LKNEKKNEQTPVENEQPTSHYKWGEVGYKPEPKIPMEDRLNAAEMNIINLSKMEYRLKAAEANIVDLKQQNITLKQSNFNLAQFVKDALKTPEPKETTEEPKAQAYALSMKKILKNLQKTPEPKETTEEPKAQAYALRSAIEKVVEKNLEVECAVRELYRYV
jgi:hypothetical protein